MVIVILAALGAGGLIGYQKYRAPNPFPQEVRQSKLDLLYPAKLPTGYSVDKKDINFNNGVLIYAATDDQNHRLVFTIQARPPNFDFDAFYKQQLTGRQQYDTAFGPATIGQNSNRSLGSLIDGDTWLLLSTNSKDVSAKEMSLVLTHLKKY